MGPGRLWLVHPRGRQRCSLAWRLSHVQRQERHIRCGVKRYMRISNGEFHIPSRTANNNERANDFIYASAAMPILGVRRWNNAGDSHNPG